MHTETAELIRVTNTHAESPAQVGDGYMANAGTRVVAFHADVTGSASRAYPDASYSSGIPGIYLSDTVGNPIGQIEFPDYPGWSVHSVGGGKTLSICLVHHG